MFLPLKNLLTSRLAEHGVLKGALVAQVVEEFKLLLKNKWGDSAVDTLGDVQFKNDTLHIKTNNSALAQEIKLSENLFLEGLDKKFKGQVKRLRIFA